MPSDTLPKNLEQPEPYSISVEEFRGTPKEIQACKVGDKITRENFINFLILSFEISKGKRSTQVVFMHWLKLKNGFNYSISLTNFISSGGWFVLSAPEKIKFREAMSQVSRHREELETDESRLEGLIAIQMKRLTDDSILLSPRLDSLKSTDTFDEFLKSAEQKMAE